MLFNKIIDDMKLYVYYIEDILYNDQTVSYKSNKSKVGSTYDSRRNVYCKFVPLYFNSKVYAGFSLYESMENNKLLGHIKNIETSHITFVSVENDYVYVTTKNSIYVLKNLGREY